MTWAVVTGGSRGIGAATCRALARDGHDVAFSWHSNDVAADATAEAVTRLGRQALAMRVDLGDLGEVAAWGRTLAEEVQPGILVLNAAETFRGSLTDHTPEVVRHVLSINLAATIELVRHLAPVMVAGGQGAIVAVASMNALRGSADSLAYSASKAGLLGLTRALAVELAPSVRVNAVAPGIIDTDMNAGPLSDPHIVSMVQRSLPMARPGTADEVAQLIAWLASPAAGYITGSVVPADGGGLASFPVH